MGVGDPKCWRCHDSGKKKCPICGGTKRTLHMKGRKPVSVPCANCAQTGLVPCDCVANASNEPQKGVTPVPA